MTRRPPAVARVLERVTATVREHDMFLPGETVLCAVSGGADSVCMVRVLVMLRRLFKIRVEVFHFDHRLRAGSSEDAAYVRRMASRLGLPFTGHSAENAPAKGESVEDWAHRARFAAFARAARDRGASKMAIGHTRDDRAETLLLAAMRGGGLDALAGLRPVQGPYVRPLLDIRRDETEAFCRALRIRPREDPTNRDTRYLRNAIRLEVLPLLERATGRDVRDALARTAELVRADADELARLATEAEAELVEEEVDGFAMAAAGLTTVPPAIASRVARSTLYRAGFVPTAELAAAVIDLAAGRPGRRRDLPGGLIATRDREYVHLPRASP